MRELAAELLGIDPADVTEEQMNEVRQIVIDTIDEMYGEEESDEESDEEEESETPAGGGPIPIDEIVGTYDIYSIANNSTSPLSFSRDGDGIRMEGDRQLYSYDAATATATGQFFSGLLIMKFVKEDGTITTTWTVENPKTGESSVMATGTKID